MRFTKYETKPMELCPWTPDIDMSEVTVENTENPPKSGDMIAKRYDGSLYLIPEEVFQEMFHTEHEQYATFEVQPRLRIFFFKPIVFEVQDTAEHRRLSYKICIVNAGTDGYYWAACDHDENVYFASLFSFLTFEKAYKALEWFQAYNLDKLIQIPETRKVLMGRNMVRIPNNWLSPNDYTPHLPPNGIFDWKAIGPDPTPDDQEKNPENQGD
ncbi:MAG: hypothetical protein AAFW00_19745 [Bacteroidota bacterium]